MIAFHTGVLIWIAIQSLFKMYLGNKELTNHLEFRIFQFYIRNFFLEDVDSQIYITTRHTP